MGQTEEEAIGMALGCYQVSRVGQAVGAETSQGPSKGLPAGLAVLLGMGAVASCRWQLGRIALAGSSGMAGTCWSTRVKSLGTRRTGTEKAKTSPGESTSRESTGKARVVERSKRG